MTGSLAGMTTAGVGMVVVCNGGWVGSGGWVGCVGGCLDVLLLVVVRFSVVVDIVVGFVVVLGVVVHQVVEAVVVLLHHVEGFIVVVEDGSQDGQVVEGVDDETIGVVELAPVSTPVVNVGAGGVTGSGGFVQSPPDGATSFNNPNPLFKDFNSGKLSLQHLFWKSSKSTVHAAAPPKPAFTTNLAFSTTLSGSSYPTHWSPLYA